MCLFLDGRKKREKPKECHEVVLNNGNQGLASSATIRRAMGHGFRSGRKLRKKRPKAAILPEKAPIPRLEIDCSEIMFCPEIF